MDGYNGYPRPSYPSHLVYFHYDKTVHYGKSLSIGSPRVLMMSSNFHFNLAQWYKFQIIGTPLNQFNGLGQQCLQEYRIEGPGKSWKYTIKAYCLEFQEGFPLKVFGANDILGPPMDGVLRNIVFENTATNISLDTTC